MKFFNYRLSDLEVSSVLEEEEEEEEEEEVLVDLGLALSCLFISKKIGILIGLYFKFQNPS